MRGVRGLVFVAIAATLSGCGGSNVAKAPVKGKVTASGQAVTAGTLTFAPVEGAANAHSLVERALALAPAHVASHVVLGKVARVRGQLDDARGHLERALELDGSNEEARRELQTLRVLAGDAEEGRKKKPATQRIEAPKEPAPGATGG